MNNPKPAVYAALKDDPTLSALIGGRVIFHAKPSLASLNEQGPCISYYEQTNSPALVGDGQELTSESVMVVDVWSLGDTSAIAQAVNNVMSGLHFIREFAGDLYESDTGVYHKSMRYRNKSRR